jgi:hypothetical protein
MQDREARPKTAIKKTGAKRFIKIGSLVVRVGRPYMVVSD